MGIGVGKYRKQGNRIRISVVCYLARPCDEEQFHFLTNEVVDHSCPKVLFRSFWHSNRFKKSNRQWATSWKVTDSLTDGMFNVIAAMDEEDGLSSHFLDHAEKARNFMDDNPNHCNTSIALFPRSRRRKVACIALCKDQWIWLEGLGMSAVWKVATHSQRGFRFLGNARALELFNAVLKMVEFYSVKVMMAHDNVMNLKFWSYNCSPRHPTRPWMLSNSVKIGI